MDLLPASSLLSQPELCRWYTEGEGFHLTGSRPPRLNLQPRSGPHQRHPSHPEPSTSLINPSSLLVELGTHMCCCTAHKLNARLKRKNPNRKREKENKNERVGKRTAVNHVLKSPAAGGRESAWPVYRSNWPAQKLAWNQVLCKPLITERTSLTTRLGDERGRMSLRQFCLHPRWCTCSFKCNSFLHIVCILTL